MGRFVTSMAALLVAVVLLQLGACDSRKKRCQRLYDRVAGCADPGHEPSKEARRAFLQRCVERFDSADVKRSRECAGKHRSCPALRACLVRRLKLQPGGSSPP